MRRLAFITGLVAAAMLVADVVSAQRATAAAGPIIVIETAKGTIEIQTLPSEAPKSVEHILSLVKRSFYRSQRVHRAEASLVQFGDPQSRDMTKQASWGTGSSFNPIGVAEISKRKHVRGAVGLAHSGNPTLADSQIYIMKTASPSLDGKHVIIGQVTSGMTVVDKLVRTDILKLVTVKEAGPKP
jgi:peptidyl-prolyl cis-trans isomerase B (cyclophilin B)